MCSPCGVWRLLWVLEEHTSSKDRIKTSAGIGRSIITPLGNLLNLNQTDGGALGELQASACWRVKKYVPLYLKFVTMP